MADHYRRALLFYLSEVRTPASGLCKKKGGECGAFLKKKGSCAKTFQNLAFYDKGGELQ
jgi:hypothetical protein